MTEIWLGYSPIGRAFEDGRLVLTGSSKLAADLRTWLKLSVFAKIEKKVANEPRPAAWESGVSELARLAEVLTPCSQELRKLARTNQERALNAALERQQVLVKEINHSGRIAFSWLPAC